MKRWMMVIGLVAVLIPFGVIAGVANSEQKNSTIAQLITQQAQEAVAAGVAGDTGPVTVQGKPYFILVLKNRIDPTTCKVVPNSGHTKVYVDMENYPISDIGVTQKIEVIDYIQQLQKGELQKEQLIKKIEDLQKVQRRIPDIDIADATFDAATKLIALVNIPKSVGGNILKLIKGVGGEVAKETFFSTMEKLRSRTFEDFNKAINGYTNILSELVRNRSMKIDDYDIAKKVLDEYQQVQHYEKSATLLAKKIYDKTDLDAAEIIGVRLLNNLSMGFTDEVIARHIELDLIGQTIPQIGIPYKVALYTQKMAEGCGRTTPIEPKADKDVIEGKYYSQDYPEYYLELRRGEIYSERLQRSLMGRTSTWRNGFLLPPEEGEWLKDKDKIYVSTKRASLLLTWIEFLVKGNGVIEGGGQSFGGPIWIKEGVGPSFSQKEVSGTYTCHTVPTIYGPDGLVLRPDGTCTYTRPYYTEMTASINGTWKIEGDRITAEFDERLYLLAVLDGGRKMVLRALDHNTLIQQGRKWTSETKKRNRTYDYKTASVLKQFSLASDFGARERLTFKVTVTGTITLEATWTSEVGTVNLALILNGPGQISYYAREDGPSPLQTEYTLYTPTAQDVAKGESWTASIVNFSERGPVSGTLKVIYPVQN